MHICHGNITLSTLVKKNLNVWELSLKHGSSETKQSYWTYITHLPIHISFIAIMSGVTPIQPVSIRWLYCRKKLIRIVTCSPYRAHSKPLLVANKVLSVHELNVYIVGIFMYKYCNDDVPDIFNDFFQRNSELHNRITRQSNDLHVWFARLDVRKFSLKIHGATTWNEIPMYIKFASSVVVFKQMLRKHLIDMNMHRAVTQFQ